MPGNIFARLEPWQEGNKLLQYIRLFPLGGSSTKSRALEHLLEALIVGRTLLLLELRFPRRLTTTALPGMQGSSSGGKIAAISDAFGSFHPSHLRQPISCSHGLPFHYKSAVR